MQIDARSCFELVSVCRVFGLCAGRLSSFLLTSKFSIRISRFRGSTPTPFIPLFLFSFVLGLFFFAIAIAIANSNPTPGQPRNGDEHLLLSSNHCNNTKDGIMALLDFAQPSYYKGKVADFKINASNYYKPLFRSGR
jgi:hypothetical protein